MLIDIFPVSALHHLSLFSPHMKSLKNNANWIFICAIVVSSLTIVGSDENLIQAEQVVKNEDAVSKESSLQLSERSNNLNTHNSLKKIKESDSTVDTVHTSETCSKNNSPANETTVNSNKTTKPTKVNCKDRVTTVDIEPIVQIVNSSILLNVVIPESNITANECALVLFYGPWCHFSAMAAPHYNALARLYPSFHVFAVNAIKYNGLNARYGIVAVPTLLLFHNGRAIAKFNETVYSLDNFVYFVGKYTNTRARGVINVTSADFFGPLPSEPIYENDYVLWLAWTFILFCATICFVKSSLCSKVVEIVRNNWREAEAQHEHEE